MNVGAKLLLASMFALAASRASAAEADEAGQPAADVPTSDQEVELDLAETWTRSLTEMHRALPPAPHAS